MTSTRTPVALVLALWGAGLGAAAQYGKISVIFDQLPQIYPDAGAAVGWAVSLVGLLGIIFGVVAGIVVARIRYRRALLLSLWLGAVVSVVQATMPSFHWFLALRAIEGLSHLGLVVAIPTLIAQITAPKDRGWALTLWGTFFGVAFAVLTWGGLPLVAAWGVPALFVAHSLYLAGFALVLMVWLRKLPGQGPDTPLSLGQVLRDHVTIYRSARISAPGLGWLFYTFCFVSILTVLPPYIPAEMRALVMGAMPLMSIVVSMTLGVWLLAHRSAVWVVCLGFGTSVLAIGWLWLQPGLPVACLALAAAMGLIQGATFAAVPQLNDTAETQAQSNGAMAQMGNLGNTLGTPVMAAALAGMGYTALPVLAGAAFLAGLLLHLTLAAQRNTATA
ncbi:MFS transporter [Pseudosulfitobacter koreensis]|uniref:MFS transporter n=1 Tax=Pseudosulfitobacter koreensis TaxID=2968472 RepID=A0ABT1YXM9_9RHOB|nr:MFS transporter [Pseudosulfitobacter koreense]MCR8825645.1 MFS transporter [Pseudosulfitobacter koreense]